MPEQSPINLVQSIYSAVGAGDFDAVLAVLHPDFAVEQSSALPFAGTWSGAEGFKALGGAIFAAWPNFAVEPLAFAETGDVVLVITRVTGSHPDAPEPLDQQMIEYWKVADGKGHRMPPIYFDPVAAARSAGPKAS